MAADIYKLGGRSFGGLTLSFTKTIEWSLMGNVKPQNPEQACWPKLGLRQATIQRFL